MVPVTVTSGSGSLIVTAAEFPNTVMLAISENTLYRDDSAACKSTSHSIISQKRSNDTKNVTSYITLSLTLFA